MFFLSLVLSVFAVRGSTTSGSSSQSNVAANLAFLQTELAATSSAQQSIVRYLTQSHLIPIGQLPRSLSSLRQINDAEETIKSRIIVSNESNHIECRISLGRAPLGSKCVSPCGCIGSQKWIQFTELNKLRRKDPSQWTKCQTCQQKFEYDIFSNYGGLPGGLVGMALDNKSILRVAMLSVSSVLVYSLSIGSWVMRLLLSRPVWQLYNHWSKITHLPLALKFWLGKIVVQYSADNYVAFERNVFLSYLIDLETSIIEKKLPVEGVEEREEEEEEEEGDEEITDYGEEEEQDDEDDEDDDDEDDEDDDDSDFD